jgi:hypothetical protein
LDESHPSLCGAGRQWQPCPLSTKNSLKARRSPIMYYGFAGSGAHGRACGQTVCLCACACLRRQRGLKRRAEVDRCASVCLPCAQLCGRLARGAGRTGPLPAQRRPAVRQGAHRRLPHLLTPAEQWAPRLHAPAPAKANHASQAMPILDAWARAFHMAQEGSPSLLHCPPGETYASSLSSLVHCPPGETYAEVLHQLTTAPVTARLLSEQGGAVLAPAEATSSAPAFL